MNPLDRDGYPFIWSACVQQTGAVAPFIVNPSGVPNINTFPGGQGISFSYVGTGIYRMLFPNAPLVLGNTFFAMYPLQSNSYPIVRIDASTVEIRCYILPTNTLSDGQFTANLTVFVTR